MWKKMKRSTAIWMEKMIILYLTLGFLTTTKKNRHAGTCSIRLTRTSKIMMMTMISVWVFFSSIVLFPFWFITNICYASMINGHAFFVIFSVEVFLFNHVFLVFFFSRFSLRGLRFFFNSIQLTNCSRTIVRMIYEWCILFNLFLEMRTDKMWTK